MKELSFKFFTLLQSFSVEEFKAFEKWLISPWCNSNKNLIRLFKKTKKYYPTYHHASLSKENLFKQVFPQGKYSDQRIYNLMSKGFQAAEQFLTFQHLKNNQNIQNQFLLKDYQKRHSNDIFFKKSSQISTSLEVKQNKTWEEHLQLYQLYRRIYHHPNQYQRQQPGNETIIKMGEQLDLIYVLERATIINEKISRSRILNKETHDISFELKKWFIVAEGIEHISIELYKKRFEYHSENYLENYLSLRQLFLQNTHRLNEKEQKVHLFSLINDTSLLTRAGLTDITEFLPLYKLGLKTGILLHQDMLSYNTFISIIMASNTKKDFEFTQQFIHNYTGKIRPDIQADVYHWAKAHTAYYQNNLTACLDILLKHNFKMPYVLLITKFLTTQTYFDLYLKDESYKTFLFNYFDSFEKWILREKKQSKFKKHSSIRFIQVCRSLAKYYAKPIFERQKVKSILDKESNIQALNWLNSRVEKVLNLRKN